LGTSVCSDPGRTDEQLVDVYGTLNGVVRQDVFHCGPWQMRRESDQIYSIARSDERTWIWWAVVKPLALLPVILVGHLTFRDRWDLPPGAPIVRLKAATA
jgi:hypothetical protein